MGDNQNSITGGAHGGSTLSQKVMKTIGKIATALAVAFSALAFTATPGSADSGAPAIVPHGHYCASYTQAGIDCSFTSYAECEAMVSGQSAECYGNTPVDDLDPWNTRAQQFSTNTRARQFSTKTRAQQFSKNTRAQQFSRNTRAQQFSRNTRAQQFSRNTRAQQFSMNTRAQQFWRPLTDLR
jgi:hypothetical protein